MNPIQQAIEALDWCIAEINRDSPSVLNARPVLTSLRSLQKEVEGVSVEQMISGAIYDFAGFLTTRSQTIKVGASEEATPIANLIVEWAKTRNLSLDDALVERWSTQARAIIRTAVAAALGRGVVNSGWCVTSEELAQWTDAYAAFKGAFDTPQMRRLFNDEYAEDARHRLREFNERMLSAAPSPEATQPATDVDLINRGCRHQTDLLTVATQPTQAEAASVTTLQTVDELIAYAAQERERDAKWQQWVERGGYDGDQQAEAPSEREAREMQEVADKLREAGYHSAANNTERTIADIKSGNMPRAVIGAALATQQAVQGEPVTQCTDTFGCTCPKHYTATPPAPGQVERDREDAELLDYLGKQTRGDVTICPPGNHGGERGHWLVAVETGKQDRFSVHANEFEGATLRDAIRAARSSEGGSND